MPRSRARPVLLALAGAVGAATAHGLDRAGQLPGVHESAAVRAAVGVPALTGWLVAAAALGWFLGSSRRRRTRVLSVLAGVPLLAALPELFARGDLFAVLEPAAATGALLQAVLFVAVLAALVLLERAWLSVRPAAAASAPLWGRARCAAPRRPVGTGAAVVRRGRSPPSPAW